jgi:hypothetical protein
MAEKDNEIDIPTTASTTSRWTEVAPQVEAKLDLDEEKNSVSMSSFRNHRHRWEMTSEAAGTTQKQTRPSPQFKINKLKKKSFAEIMVEQQQKERSGLGLLDISDEDEDDTLHANDNVRDDNKKPSPRSLFEFDQDDRFGSIRQRWEQDSSKQTPAGMLPITPQEGHLQKQERQLRLSSVKKEGLVEEKEERRQAEPCALEEEESLERLEQEEEEAPLRMEWERLRAKAVTAEGGEEKAATRNMEEDTPGAAIAVEAAEESDDDAGVEDEQKLLVELQADDEARLASEARLNRALKLKASKQTKATTSKQEPHPATATVDEPGPKAEPKPEIKEDTETLTMDEPDQDDVYASQDFPFDVSKEDWNIPKHSGVWIVSE